MKSSAPQTTMSISLAPMIAKRPPEGAQTQQEAYDAAGGKEGTRVGYKRFTEQLRDLAEDESTDVCREKFNHNGRGGVVFVWREVAK